MCNPFKYVVAGVCLMANFACASVSPADGAQFVAPQDAVITWRAPAGAVSGNLYLGTDRAAMEALAPETLRGTAAMKADNRAQRDVGALALNTTYFWRAENVAADGTKTPSPIYSFRTEPLAIPGNVVAHLPKAGKIYYDAPCLAVLPNGDYIASALRFGPKSGRDTTDVFRSVDQGRNWTQIASVKGIFLSTLFARGNALYLLGSTGYKNPVRFVIRRSDDGGVTWTTPTDEHTGILPEFVNRNTAMPIVEHDGRLWFARIDGRGQTTTQRWCSAYRIYLVSVGKDADLLEAANWTLTPKVDFDDANWKYPWFTQKGGWLEPNPVLTPDGSLAALVRVDTDHFKNPPVEKAALIAYGKDGQSAAFDPDKDFFDFPGGAKKFCVQYDTPSKRYWALSNPVLPAHYGANIERARNALLLLSSADLRTWQAHRLLQYHPDIDHVGFQYPYFLIDGDDLLIVTRLAYDDGVGGADSQHNSNFVMFERVQDFRKTLSETYDGLKPQAATAPAKAEARPDAAVDTP